MKIIDFELLGNVVKFYLGKDDDNEYHGDDWNDAPYDCNAGTVLDKFVIGTIEFAFTSDWEVLEPADDCFRNANCPWSKNDLKNRLVPCVIAVRLPKDAERWRFSNSFVTYSAADQTNDIVKFYIGDTITIGEEHDNYKTINAKVINRY